MVLISCTHDKDQTTFLILYGTYISKSIQKLLEDAMVAPKMLIQTKRTTRVTIIRTSCRPATQPGGRPTATVLILLHGQMTARHVYHYPDHSRGDQEDIPLGRTTGAR
ncbi:hypothetical protein Hanom_Chr16g01431231 [Helianthus anomalus]